MGAIKKTVITFFSVAAIGAGAGVAIDYNHGLSRIENATPLKRQTCKIAYAYGPLKYIGINYKAAAVNLLGPKLTYTMAVPIKGNTKAIFAYAWFNKRAQDARRCYDFPVSGDIADFIKAWAAPRYTQ